MLSKQNFVVDFVVNLRFNWGVFARLGLSAPARAILPFFQSSSLPALQPSSLPVFQPSPLPLFRNSTIVCRDVGFSAPARI
jgi:hypothetical protein